MAKRLIQSELIADLYKREKRILYNIKKFDTNKISEKTLYNRLKLQQKELLSIEREYKIYPNAWFKLMQLKYLVKNKLGDLNGKKD